MRNKSSFPTNEDPLPNVIKKKQEKYKLEGRLINRKSVKFDDYVTVQSNENIGNRKIKLTLEIINYTSLTKRPIIPRYGKLISEVLKLVLTDAKGNEITKKDNIVCSIKSPEIDRYSYPVLFDNDEWKIGENYSVESDGISVSGGDWSMIVLIKEPPNEIITINPNGAMIYTELDKVTSLRIPKGNFKEDINCKIQFVNISSESLEDFRLVYEDQLAPFIELSQIVVIQLIDNDRDLINNDFTLRRTLSIKIPLPEWVTTSLREVNFDTKRTVQDQKKEKLGFYFLHKIGETWTFFDNSLKFTQNSLEFDTKHFGSFIFVNCRENREIKLCANMSLVENLQSSERGVILVFLWLKNRDWCLWIEPVPVNRITSVRECLQNNGLLFVEQSVEYPIEKEAKNGHRQSRRPSKKDVIQRRTIDLFEDIQFKLSIYGEVERCDDSQSRKNKLIKDSSEHSNEHFEESINFNDFNHIGKRKVAIIDPKDDIEAIIDPDLSYHRHSRQSNAIIVPIKPLDRLEVQWTTIIIDKLTKRSVYDSSGSTRKEALKVQINDIEQTDIEPRLIEPDQLDTFNASTLSDQEKEFNFQCDITLEILNSPSNLMAIQPQKFRFYIPTEVMKDYFNVSTKEEIHELEMEKMRLENDAAAVENQKEEISHTTEELNRPKMVNYNRIDILSNPRVRNRCVTKDPKIISIKSMLALSSVIRQGLTLAVYLSLPDNVIAGIGFDSLSQMSMNGVNNTTYKVLVTWKKMIHLNKIAEDIYVEKLMDALKMLNYENIALLVEDHWRNNKDISLDDCHRCLLQRPN